MFVFFFQNQLFLHSLSSFPQVYLMPLREKAKTSQKIITLADVDVIFSNVEEIVQIGCVCFYLFLSLVFSLHFFFLENDFNVKG